MRTFNFCFETRNADGDLDEVRTETAVSPCAIGGPRSARSSESHEPVTPGSSDSPTRAGSSVHPKAIASLSPPEGRLRPNPFGSPFRFPFVLQRAGTRLGNHIKMRAQTNSKKRARAHSPGAGKTTLRERSSKDLAAHLTIEVIAGDQATTHYAERIRATDARLSRSIPEPAVRCSAWLCCPQ